MLNLHAKGRGLFQAWHVFVNTVLREQAMEAWVSKQQAAPVSQEDWGRRVSLLLLLLPQVAIPVVCE